MPNYILKELNGEFAWQRLAQGMGATELNKKNRGDASLARCVPPNHEKTTNKLSKLLTNLT